MAAIAPSFRLNLAGLQQQQQQQQQPVLSSRGQFASLPVPPTYRSVTGDSLATFTGTAASQPQYVAPTYTATPTASPYGHYYGGGFTASFVPLTTAAQQQQQQQQFAAPTYTAYTSLATPRAAGPITISELMEHHFGPATPRPQPQPVGPLAPPVLPVPEQRITRLVDGLFGPSITTPLPAPKPRPVPAPEVPNHVYLGSDWGYSPYNGGLLQPQQQHPYGGYGGAAVAANASPYPYYYFNSTTTTPNGAGYFAAPTFTAPAVWSAGAGAGASPGPWQANGGW